MFALPCANCHEKPINLKGINQRKRGHSVARPTYKQGGMSSDVQTGRPSVEAAPEHLNATDESNDPMAALALLARLHHIACDPAALRHDLGLSPGAGLTDAELLLAAKKLGLKSKLSTTPPDRLNLAALPALARIHVDGSPRWVLIAQCDGQRVLYQDPSEPGGGRPTIEPLSAFAAKFAPGGGPGTLLLASSRASLAGSLAKFDFSWFIPSIVRHRKLIGEVMLVSLFLQLFALVSPLFFQVVMDKVLVHRGMSTPGRAGYRAGGGDRL